jgi:hypothetical protein
VTSSVTQELVDELLAASPLAVGFAKGVATGSLADLATSLEQEVAFQQILRPTTREAGAVFMEKRKLRHRHSRRRYAEGAEAETAQVAASSATASSGKTHARYVAQRFGGQLTASRSPRPAPPCDGIGASAIGPDADAGAGDARATTAARRRSQPPAPSMAQVRAIRAQPGTKGR